VYMRLVRVLTSSGVKVEFVKESLTFASDDSPMNTLLLSMLGAFRRQWVRQLGLSPFSSDMANP
jgi:hypothetical protein